MPSSLSSDIGGYYVRDVLLCVMCSCMCLLKLNDTASTNTTIVNTTHNTLLDAPFDTRYLRSFTFSSAPSVGLFSCGISTRRFGSVMHPPPRTHSHPIQIRIKSKSEREQDDHQALQRLTSSQLDDHADMPRIAWIPFNKNGSSSSSKEEECGRRNSDPSIAIVPYEVMKHERVKKEQRRRSMISSASAVTGGLRYRPGDNQVEDASDSSEHDADKEELIADRRSQKRRSVATIDHHSLHSHVLHGHIAEEP